MSETSMWGRIFPTGLRDSRYLLLWGFLFAISAFNRAFAHLSVSVAGIPLFPGELTLGGLLVLEGVRLLRTRQMPFRVGAASALWALYLCVGLVFAFVGLARGFGLAALRDFALVYYVLLFFLVQSILQAHAEPARLFASVLIGSVFGSAFTVISLLVTPRLSFGHAASGALGLSAWVGLAYVAANPGGLSGRPRAWRWAVVLPLAAVIYLSGFRTMVVVIAASLAVAGVWALLARGPARTAARSLLVVGGVLCLVFAGIVAAARLTFGAPEPGSPDNGEVSLTQGLRVVTDRWVRAFTGGGGGEASVSFRLSVWTNAVARIRSHPWTGIGFGPAPSLHPDSYCDRPTSSTSNCGNAHNTYLTLAMRMGLPAFALWAVASLWVAGGYFRATLARRADEAAVRTAAFLSVALASLLAYAFFQLFFESPYLSPFYWVTLGVMAELTRRWRAGARATLAEGWTG
jgi:O-antigen ligase